MSDGPATIQHGPWALSELPQGSKAQSRSPRHGQSTVGALLSGTPDMVFRMSADATFLDVLPASDLDPLVPPGEFIGRWDQAGDPIAIAAGFTTDSTFPWVHSDLNPLLTYLEVLQLSAQGDITRQMSFKYIAARLNEAAFGVPTGIDTLLDDFDTYFSANPVGSKPSGAVKSAGQALLNHLNTYFSTVGEDFCPTPTLSPSCRGRRRY